MDLQEHLRQAAAHLVDSPDWARHLAARFTFDTGPRKGDRDEALAWLAGKQPAGASVRVLSQKRNLLFTHWTWPGVGAGMAILAFDQDGLLTHASIAVHERASPPAGP